LDHGHFTPSLGRSGGMDLGGLFWILFLKGTLPPLRNWGLEGLFPGLGPNPGVGNQVPPRKVIPIQFIWIWELFSQGWPRVIGVKMGGRTKGLVKLLTTSLFIWVPIGGPGFPRIIGLPNGFQEFWIGPII